MQTLQFRESSIEWTEFPLPKLGIRLQDRNQTATTPASAAASLGMLTVDLVRRRKLLDQRPCRSALEGQPISSAAHACLVRLAVVQAGRR